MEFIDPISKIEFLKLFPSQRLKWLREYSRGLGNEEALKGVQKLLFDLELEELQYSSLEPRSSTNPHEFDVLVNDINGHDFSRIGEEPGISRLSAVNSVGSFPLIGIIYGTSNKVFVACIVKKRDIIVQVIFLIDTGSPNTYLREDSLAALGHSDAIPSDTLVMINGVGLTVFPSRGHFSNVDLLGQDFFTSAASVLTIDYKTKEVLVTTSG
jgi:hypothetical protein